MPDTLALQAIAALRDGDYAEARDFIKNYAKGATLELRHYLIRGLAELALKDWAAARHTFAEAWLRYPKDAHLPFNLGVAQENLGDLKGAAASYERSLQLDPGLADACGNLSNVYCRQGRFEDAEAMARRALKLGASKAQALNSLGLALNRQNKFIEAATAFDEAIELEPENSAFLVNRANLAVDGLDFERACEFFIEARRIGKDAPLIRHHEGMARLLAGDVENGWTLCEARLEVEGALRLIPPAPRWRGEDLSGKRLMIVAEQGFGDAIQFCRYGKFFERQGAKLIWLVPPVLQRLFAHNLSGEVISEKDPLPQTDFYLPMLSLPLALNKPKPEKAEPYFTAAPPEKLLPESSRSKKIGLVWSGSPTHERDFERSISLKNFAPLFEKIDAGFYAPFTGGGLDQIDGEPVTRLDHLITDFADTAALLAQLDCLVTVDTAAAHLAGALGVKTYMLLPYCPDWRWGTSGQTTPWYRSITLLRQPKPGDWRSVMAELPGKLMI